MTELEKIEKTGYAPQFSTENLKMLSNSRNFWLLD